MTTGRSYLADPATAFKALRLPTLYEPADMVVGIMV
jgi:hypothetical protein